MADRSKSWTSAQRERIEGSGALDYLIEVARGEVKTPDDRRIRTCMFLVNKRLPDIKAVEVSGQVHSVSWNMPQLTAPDLTNILPTLPPSVLKSLSGTGEPEKPLPQLTSSSDKSPPNQAA
jgi:hypothetical protein